MGYLVKSAPGRIISDASGAPSRLSGRDLRRVRVSAGICGSGLRHPTNGPRKFANSDFLLLQFTSQEPTDVLTESLVASLGGPRSGGYTSQHLDKVNKLVLLAPVYNATASATPPAESGRAVPMNTQSHADFTANWDRQVGCPDQYDPAVARTVWEEMLASDSVGSTWGTGVRTHSQPNVNAGVVDYFAQPTTVNVVSASGL